MMAFVKD